MKDGVKAEEQVEVSRQELFQDYENSFLRLCTEVGPCRDEPLLRRAARYLQRAEPEPGETFTVFPFYQTVDEVRRSPSLDCRKFLTAFIKATELLEILCVNLVVQPWKKEIKRLKTFTGAFVYCLVPVLSASTLQSVLASIGYLPHQDTPPSEYRLSEDADPDRAKLVGFELLLARVKCYHLLELHDKDHNGQQEWLEVLQGRVGSKNLEKPKGKKMTTVQKEKDEEKSKEGMDVKEVPLHLDSSLTVKPHPKPRRIHAKSEDQSIVEMQNTYPDLAFRGRPLIPYKRHSSSTAEPPKSPNNVNEDTHTTELHPRDDLRGTKAGAPTTQNQNDDNTPGETSADSARNSACTHESSVGAAAQGRGDGELSRPQAMLLHITMRTGSSAGKRERLRKPEPTSEPPARIHQQTGADKIQDRTNANQRLSSLSSADEEQELRQLKERMGQLPVQETKEEVKRKQDDERGEENKSEERKKERRISAERKAEEHKLRKLVMEMGPVKSRAASRSTKSSLTDQKLPAVPPPSQLTVGAADSRGRQGGSRGQQAEEDTESEEGRQREEQRGQSYSII